MAHWAFFVVQDEGKLPVTFELSDTLFAKADVQPATTEEVYLWLGVRSYSLVLFKCINLNQCWVQANVMLAYKPAEAKQLLTDKLASAKTTLSNAIEDLDWLREQITVTEVNLARCYNYSVLLRRQNKLKEGGDDEDPDDKSKD